MKNFYDKNKGKVHPSPPSGDALSEQIHLLPAAIITLVSALSLQDREVLAYLITKSINNDDAEDNKRSFKCKNPTIKTHKSPLFNCHCFDCYTFYWFRWHSSPNRDLIDQAIEAFEEHLAHTNQLSKSITKPKKKHKTGRRPDPEPAPNDAFPACADGEVEVVGGDAAPEMEVFEVPARNNRSFGRESWPDVLGMFHSSLWSLWGPNI